MTKKFLIFVLCVALPYIITTYVFNRFGTFFGFCTMILVFIALFLIFKPKIFTIIGRQKYFKNHDTGFKYLEKAYKTGRMNPQDTLIYAYLLLRDGELTRAERLIVGTLNQKKKLLTEKNILSADLNMAIILWKKNDLVGAIKKMEEVYSTGYRSTVHYQTLGIFYLLNNELEKGEKFINEAVDYNSDDASIMDNLGLLYIKQGKYEDAKKVYENIFESQTPDFIEVYYNYATVLENLGELTLARDYYIKALGCPERFLSTVKLSLAEAALERVENKL